MKTFYSFIVCLAYGIRDEKYWVREFLWGEPRELEVVSFFPVFCVLSGWRMKGGSLLIL